MTINKNYKDSIFRSLFNTEKCALELYNAIFRTNYQDESVIEINTLLEDIFSSHENDVSFNINNKIVVLVEHQSTINKNMPVRILSYIARIYEKIIDKKIYQESLVKIPRPEFIVLYNGKKTFPKEKIFKLSDAFEKIDNNDLISLDLIVRVININKGVNPELENESETLNGYTTFIARVREYEKKYTLEEAGKLAVKYCIKNNILADYFKQNSSKVVEMLILNYNQEDHIEVLRKEALEKGRMEAKNYMLELLAKGLSHEEIKKKIEEIS